MKNKKNTKKNEYNKLKKIVLTAIVLIFIAIVMFIISLNMRDDNLTVEQRLIKLLEKNKVHDVVITKNESKMEENNYFQEDDLEYVKSKVSSNISEIYIVNENNVKSSIKFDEKKKENNKMFYDVFDVNYIQKVDDWSQYKIIGKRAVKSNEIVVSKYIADLIIKFGIQLKDDKEIHEVYKPSDYKELVNFGKEIYFGSILPEGVGLIITGIVDDDISEYNVLKFLKSNSLDNMLFYSLKDKFRGDLGVSGKLNMIYVNNDFFEITNFPKNSMLIPGFRYISHKVIDKYITPQGWVGYPNRTIRYFDGNKITTTDNLNKDEVIIYLPYLKAYANSISYDDIVKVVRKDCDENMSLDECFYKFINDNHLIGSTIDIEIADSSLAVTGKEKNEYKDLKIIGYAVTDNDNLTYEYYSKELLEPYMLKNNEVIALKVHEDDFKKLKEIVSNFEINPVYDDKNVHYYIETPYNNEALNTKYILEAKSKFLKILSAVFLIVGIICAFIGFNINNKINNKKKTSS